MSPNEILLSWNPPNKTEGEIWRYKVLYTFGQTPYTRNLGNVTRVNIQFDNKATAIEASVGVNTENNTKSQVWYFSETVHIEFGKGSLFFLT